MRLTPEEAAYGRCLSEFASEIARQTEKAAGGLWEIHCVRGEAQYVTWTVDGWFAWADFSFEETGLRIRTSKIEGAQIDRLFDFDEFLAVLKTWDLTKISGF